MENPLPKPTGGSRPAVSGADRLGKAWYLLFLLSGIWIFCFQLDATSLFLVFAGLADAYEAISSSFYPVFLLGFAVIPFVLDKAGIGNNPIKNRRLMIALPAVTLALLLGFVLLCLFAAAIPKPLSLTLYYLTLLLPSIVMGMALRRGVDIWEPRKAALYIGIWHIAFYVIHDICYFYFIYGQTVWSLTTVFVGAAVLYAVVFIGLLVALIKVRVWLKDDLTRTEPAAALILPNRFIRHALLCVAASSLILSFLNTVFYFENMEDFHTPLYEIVFSVAAIGVMGLATALFHKGKWVVVTVFSILLICLGQGLSLFTTTTEPLRILYNYASMAGKAPILLCGLYMPILLACTRRKAGWLAALGFVFLEAASFLPGFLNSLGMTFRDKPMPGILLAASLALTGALVALGIQYERFKTGNLLAEIRAEQKRQKSCDEIITELNLTPRERSITSLLLKGDSMKIIAAKLSISQATVNTHMTNLYRKLNIQSRSELFALFMVRESDEPNHVNASLDG